MDQFRTEVKLSPAPQMDHQSMIFTTGSCFADDLGQRFLHNKFSISVNPFGVTYNPLSIHKALLLSLRNEKPSDHSYVLREGIWRHFDFHSQWSASSREQLKAQLENGIQLAGDFLKRTKILLITYGTSWVFELKESKSVVANCHKNPSRDFDRYLLSPSQIIASFEELLTMLTERNPSAKIILTVSPVRHTKDNLELNQVSKSVLRVACHYIASQFPGVDYFPAYEIMMDDLRDYRFYEKDMLHPSEAAQEYIWDKFGDRYLTQETQSLIDRWSEIQKSLAHRPFDHSSEEHQSFLRKTLQKVLELKMHFDVSEEIKLIESQLEAGKSESRKVR